MKLYLGVETAAGDPYEDRQDVAGLGLITAVQVSQAPIDEGENAGRDRKVSRHADKAQALAKNGKVDVAFLALGLLLFRLLLRHSPNPPLRRPQPVRGIHNTAG